MRKQGNAPQQLRPFPVHLLGRRRIPKSSRTHTVDVEQAHALVSEGYDVLAHFAKRTSLIRKPFQRLSTAQGRCTLNEVCHVSVVASYPFNDVRDAGCDGKNVPGDSLLYHSSPENGFFGLCDLRLFVAGDLHHFLELSLALGFGVGELGVGFLHLLHNGSGLVCLLLKGV